MSAAVMELNRLVNNLSDKDVELVIAYVEKIVDSKGENIDDNQRIMNQIGDLLASESTWNSEEDMLAEMANFRRSRIG